VIPERGNRSRGFSLVETVLALGIVGFAVVAIVGLLPLAVQSARDSMVETDATLIARRIHSELSVGTGANRTLSMPGENSTNIDLAMHGCTHGPVCFNQSGGLESDPARMLYTNYVRVFTNTGTSNLSQISIEVASPGTTNIFTTLLHYQP
jgi:uncharacterized protein (TIGR02598 family)